MNMPKKSIGILGGMGPLATADLFRKIVTLTDAARDNDHIRIYIDDNATIPDRTAAILEDGPSPLPAMTCLLYTSDSKVADLTVDQIAQIFTGAITDWSEVGGDAGTISCIGREAGSGTRDGFESITGTEDTCVLAQELTSTGAVIEAVKGNPNAIGYASLSAVEGQEGIKALTVGGVACTEETVLDGSYEIQRPFVLVTKEGTELSAQAQAFFDFATSTAANDLIKNAGAVPVAQ